MVPAQLLAEVVDGEDSEDAEGDDFLDDLELRRGRRCRTPMRLAGTWRQYSKKAMRPTDEDDLPECDLLYLRWPYQAKVIKMFDPMSRRIVHMQQPPNTSYLPVRCIEMSIADNLSRLHEEIAAACRKAGRAEQRGCADGREQGASR